MINVRQSHRERSPHGVEACVPSRVDNPCSDGEPNHVVDQRPKLGCEHVEYEIPSRVYHGVDCTGMTCTYKVKLHAVEDRARQVG